MIKRLIPLSVGLLVAFALLMATGHRTVVRADEGCGPATLRNSYGFALSGLFSPSFNGAPQQISRFIPIAAAGTFTFDGRSTVTRSFTASFGGAIAPITDSGTYSLNSNCTGSAFFPDAGESWNLVVINGGKEIDTTIATSGRALAGVLTRQ